MVQIHPGPPFRYGPVKSGAPGQIRTADPWFRKPILYPAELRARDAHSIINLPEIKKAQYNRTFKFTGHFMSQDQAKINAAKQALEFIKPGCTLGVGTGSTVNFFIDYLKSIKNKIELCVSSSKQSTERLKANGFQVTDLNQIPALDVYIDGADEVDPHKNLIKGGGGAHTLEKLLAVNSKNFVCMVDPSKCVEFLGRFPVPVEVLAMARSYVARELIKLKSQPVYRENFITDSGNIILDCVHLPLDNPLEMENIIKNITGVIEVGIFAKRKPDHLIVGKA